MIVQATDAPAEFGDFTTSTQFLIGRFNESASKCGVGSTRRNRNRKCGFSQGREGVSRPTEPLCW